MHCCTARRAGIVQVPSSVSASGSNEISLKLVNLHACRPRARPPRRAPRRTHSSDTHPRAHPWRRPHSRLRAVPATTPYAHTYRLQIVKEQMLLASPSRGCSPFAVLRDLIRSEPAQARQPPEAWRRRPSLRVSSSAKNRIVAKLQARVKHFFACPSDPPLRAFCWTTHAYSNDSDGPATRTI